jgi:hypothetical protein
MKKIVFILMVCLMAAPSFASVSFSANGSWGTATNWQNNVVPTEATSGGELKIIKTSVTNCTLDVDAGSFTTTKVTVSGNGGLIFTFAAGGSIREGKEFDVGCGSSGTGTPTGILNQTGGTLTLNDTGAVNAGKLQIGYKSGSAGVGNGTYTISGGTINGTGSIYVGSGSAGVTGGSSGSVGNLVVSGTGGTISVGGQLFVGEGDPTSVYTGTGTLTFNVAGGVSAINVSNTTLSLGAAGSVANLLVNLTGAAATGDIVLVNDTSATAVAGVFSNAAWGSTITLGANTYILSDTYDAGTMTNGAGNDIALVVPEPVTMALLGLGFLAIRRKK